MNRKQKEKEIEEYYAQLPEWYWARGLHDAKILSFEELVLPVNRKERKPLRNCFVMGIDSSDALFDRTVKKICLYNYKIKTPEIDICSFKKAWWLHDDITESNGVYTLKIEFTDCRENFNFIITFEKAVVEKIKTS